MAFLYKSSDIALKDFYFDMGRWCVVSTKCPNEKDLKWRQLWNRTGLFVQLLDGTKVIKTISRENVSKVFDVPITAAARNDMAYRNSPVTTVVSPEPIVTPVPEKEAVYHVCKINKGSLDLNTVATNRTLKAAQDTAEYLARSNPDTRYAVIQLFGIVKTMGVTWE